MLNFCFRAKGQIRAPLASSWEGSPRSEFFSGDKKTKRFGAGVFGHVEFFNCSWILEKTSLPTGLSKHVLVMRLQDQFFFQWRDLLMFEPRQHFFRPLYRPSLRRHEVTANLTLWRLLFWSKQAPSAEKRCSKKIDRLCRWIFHVTDSAQCFQLWQNSTFDHAWFFFWSNSDDFACCYPGWSPIQVSRRSCA